MSESLRITPLTKGLIGLAGSGFLAWAGVVWSGIDSVRSVASEVSSTLLRVELQLERVEQQISLHETKPWHPGAGEALSALRERNATLQRFMKKEGDQ